MLLSLDQIITLIATGAFLLLAAKHAKRVVWILGFEGALGERIADMLRALLVSYVVAGVASLLGISVGSLFGWLH